MANRRMFAKTITNSDDFLELSAGAQLLYFHLGMNADDDGFFNNYRTWMRNTGAREDDLKLLIASGFVIAFPGGVMVIRDWKVHNYIQSDRYTPTRFVDEKALLTITKDGQYGLDTQCIQNVSNMYPQVRIDKVSIGKESIKEPSREYPGARENVPSLDEVKAYCTEQGIDIDVECFYNYYASRGWLLDGEPVRSWQALAKCWKTRENQFAPQPATPPTTTTNDDGNGGTVV